MSMPSNVRGPILALAALVAAGLSAPASAAAEPSTRLVDCRSGTCLMISGQRANAASAVAINGNPVAVEGGRKWRVRLPVETVRAWSEPYARTITVAIAEPGADAAAEARLPIGLLGHVENLAMLVVSVK